MLCAKSAHETPVPQPHARNTLVSLIDHPYCLTVVHMTPFSTSVFPVASPVFQQCTRKRSCVSNITKDNNTRRNTRKRSCTNTTVSHPQSAVIKVRYARVNIYHGVKMLSVVATKMMFSLPIVLPMSSDSSTPPRPDAPQVKDELLWHRHHRCPYHILSTLTKSLVRNLSIVLRAVTHRTSVARFQVYILSDVQICFVHHVDSIV